MKSIKLTCHIIASDEAVAHLAKLGAEQFAEVRESSMEDKVSACFWGVLSLTSLSMKIKAVTAQVSDLPY